MYTVNRNSEWCFFHICGVHQWIFSMNRAGVIEGFKGLAARLDVTRHVSQARHVGRQDLCIVLKTKAAAAGWRGVPEKVEDGRQRRGGRGRGGERGFAC